MVVEEAMVAEEDLFPSKQIKPLIPKVLLLEG